MARRGIAFYGALSVTVLVCSLLVIPIALSIVSGVMKNYSAGLSGGFTFRWINEVWTQYSSTIMASLGLAAACLLITTTIGVPAAYVLPVKRQNLWTRAIEEALVFPMAVPGIAYRTRDYF